MGDIDEYYTYLPTNFRCLYGYPIQAVSWEEAKDIAECKAAYFDTKLVRLYAVSMLEFARIRNFWA